MPRCWHRSILKMTFDWLSLVEVGATLLAISVIYVKWKLQYWQRRNLFYLKPAMPSFTDKVSFTDRTKSLYNDIKIQGLKHGGFYVFTTPIYCPVDLDYLKNILTKDFQYFVDRGGYYNERDDPLSAHLFSISGVRWRNLRAKLTPTFSSGKMKIMFQTMINCLDSLMDIVDHHSQGLTPLDIKEEMGRFTTDIIGSCAFGLECNSFKDADSPFRIYGRKAFELDFFNSMKILFMTMNPNLSRLLRLVIVKPDVAKFFTKIVRDTITYREKNQVKRNDFLQMMMEMKSDSYDKQDGNKLTMDELAAHCFVFFIGGFETSSTTSTFLLYELAKHQDIQQKARDEIEDVIAKHGAFTYESLNDMKYLTQVVDETLRLHPTGPLTLRRCVKDYKVPGEDVIIERGTHVLIPIVGIHSDPEFYPEPDRFDPERFSDQNKQNRHPYAYIPFGEGPRICIGARFGVLQTKVGVVSLLKNYKFTINEKTKEPLVMDVNTPIQTVDGGVWLNVHKIIRN